jgi:Uma2 family endonuclease
VSTISNPVKGFTVDQYDALIENGILPESGRFELIHGRVVEKDMKGPPHTVASERTRRAIDRLLPPGWRTREEKPVRIPPDSEPEPDVSVVRGEIEEYENQDPGPDDVALVVEVTRSTVAKDRAMIPVYAGGGIPVYWIVNVPDRQLELYADRSAPVILTENDRVDLVIDGKVVGQIPVVDLLPRR